VNQPAYIDASPATALALCRVCGARELRLTRAAALQAAAAHQLRAHGDERAAQQLRWRAQLAATRR
jgi:hypothetical protein